MTLFWWVLIVSSLFESKIAWCAHDLQCLYVTIGSSDHFNTDQTKAKNLKGQDFLSDEQSVHHSSLLARYRILVFLNTIDTLLIYCHTIVLILFLQC